MEYKDMDGNPISLFELIKAEPLWAESRICAVAAIKELEKAERPSDPL